MSIEAMKLARQIIWRYRHETPLGNQPYMIAHEADEAIERIDQSLAKQEQRSVSVGEPVALVTGVYGGRFTYAPFKESLILPVGMALYSSPQQRTWVGLTDEERRSLQEWRRIQEELGPVWAPMMLYLYLAIEAKLREKNSL